MNYDIIGSSSAIIKRLSKLNTKKYRDESGTFLIEGEKLLKEALKSGLNISSVIIERERFNKSAPLIERLNSEGIKVYIAESAAVAKLCDTVTPQGIVSHVYKKKQLDLNDIQEGGLYIALEGLQDPGNIGTIVRTAEACGLDGVIADKNCADIFSPKVIRAGMGSTLRFPIYFTDDMSAAAEKLKAKGIAVYAAAASKNGVSVTDAFAGEKNYAVIIGNEGNGITEKTKAACSDTVYIPMKGITESFNAALAAAIIMWEMSK